MKKTIITAGLILIFGNASFAMQRRMPDLNKILYMTALKNIAALQENADNGDVDSENAIKDFYESIKNRDYIISNSSKKLLKALGLLDMYGRVDDATREAFKQCGSQE